MIVWLVVLAAAGVWRTAVVLRRGGADRTTGAILIVTAPILAFPVVWLAWRDASHGVELQPELGVAAAGLGAVCVVLGVILLVGRKKKAG